MKWNDDLGGYEELDTGTRDDINDWAQRNALGWASPGSRIIQEGVLDCVAATGESHATVWLGMKSSIAPSDILEKVALAKMGHNG